ncbi:hypothetical protein P0Y35_17010 [Kiritimatiellaeota bacterium B1221]|nr:hypothetical protein [Kiritimatiellaeota bacterium B1221]
MNPARKSLPSLPLILGLISLALFVPGIAVMENTRAWGATMQLAVPALFLGGISLVWGAVILKGKPSGKVYGLAVTGSITGGLAIIFWVVMVPMMMVFALPARDADPEQPLVHQSGEQMKIWVRHIKTFYRDEGRLPVKLEELVATGYASESLLYDSRQASKNVPSFRLMVKEMPPEGEWATTPILEGRIPNPRDGTRLIAYPDERLGVVKP